MPTREAWRRLHATEGLVRMPHNQPSQAGSHNPERDARIAAALRAGTPQREIAEQWGISIQRIYQIAKREGVPLGDLYRQRLAHQRRVRRSPAEAAVRRGVPVAEVAVRYQVSPETVRTWVPDWKAYKPPKPPKAEKPATPSKTELNRRAKLRISQLRHWESISREERIRILQDRGIWRGQAGTDDDLER